MYGYLYVEGFFKNGGLICCQERVTLVPWSLWKRMCLFDALDFNLRAICESNIRQDVRKSQGRKKSSVTCHMIRGTRIKNPRSNRGGLKQKLQDY